MVIKAPGGEGPFNNYNIRSFKEGKRLEYFINIEGKLDQNNFMNDYIIILKKNIKKKRNINVK